MRGFKQGGGSRLRLARLVATALTGSLLITAAFAPVTFAAAPNPAPGSADVDGDTSDWSLGGDFFADMTDAGRADQPVRAKLYLRYDCEEEVLYGLVLVQGEEQGRQDRTDEAYLRIDGSGKLMSATHGNDGTPPDFEWVNGDGELADGWEASGELAPGTYTVRAHILVADDSADGYTPMDVIGGNAPLVIECGAVEPTDQVNNPTPTPAGNVLPTTKPPTGNVGGATGRPRTTLPPTDTVTDATAPAAGQDGIGLMLALLAAAVGGCALITPARRRVPVKETSDKE